MRNSNKYLWLLSRTKSIFVLLMVVSFLSSQVIPLISSEFSKAIELAVSCESEEDFDDKEEEGDKLSKSYMTTFKFSPFNLERIEKGDNLLLESHTDIHTPPPEVGSIFA